MSGAAKRGRGSTLIELAVVISLLGILAAGSAVFVKPALDAYFAAQRRAELVDALDTATRRMMRDLRLALPNSVRVDGSGHYVEILMTRNGGRYRSAHDASGASNEAVLDFAAASTRFDTLGSLPAAPGQLVVPGDYVVVHNLGIPGADAYAGAPAGNLPIARIADYAEGGGALPGEDRITFAAPNRFPLESPGRRFFVVSGAVTYACVPGAVDAGGDGTGSLRRWSGYAFAGTSAAPVSAPAGALDALLANYVSGCSIEYTPLALQSRGLVSIRLTLTRGGESATLYHEVHVNNVP